ncbi:MAG: hypothetical protein VX777_00725 [Chlamydiota bacterium]|nr:hypothetical protein [Chlamydiota bacterium]
MVNYPSNVVESGYVSCPDTPTLKETSSNSSSTLDVRRVISSPVPGASVNTDPDEIIRNRSPMVINKCKKHSSLEDIINSFSDEIFNKDRNVLGRQSEIERFNDRLIQGIEFEICSHKQNNLEVDSLEEIVTKNINRVVDEFYSKLKVNLEQVSVEDLSIAYDILANTIYEIMISENVLYSQIAERILFLKKSVANVLLPKDPVTGMKKKKNLGGKSTKLLERWLRFFNDFDENHKSISGNKLQVLVKIISERVTECQSQFAEESMVSSLKLSINQDVGRANQVLAYMELWSTAKAIAILKQKVRERFELNQLDMRISKVVKRIFLFDDESKRFSSFLSNLQSSEIIRSYFPDYTALLNELKINGLPLDQEVKNIGGAKKKEYYQKEFFRRYFDSIYSAGLREVYNDDFIEREVENLFNNNYFEAKNIVALGTINAGAILTTVLRELLPGLNSLPYTCRVLQGVTCSHVITSQDAFSVTTKRKFHVLPVEKANSYGMTYEKVDNQRSLCIFDLNWIVFYRNKEGVSKWPMEIEVSNIERGCDVSDEEFKQVITVFENAVFIPGLEKPTTKSELLNKALREII